VDRVFLDANVLFSAAWRPDGRVRRLWELRDVELLTSEYALEEARRNLEGAERVRALARLLRTTTVVETHDVVVPLPAAASCLPADDRPILLAAMTARATHLLTGNSRDFGPLFGRRVGGVMVLLPGEYLVRVGGR
jgi:uncharacterized protein